MCIFLYTCPLQSIPASPCISASCTPPPQMQNLWTYLAAGTQDTIYKKNLLWVQVSSSGFLARISPQKIQLLFWFLEIYKRLKRGLGKLVISWYSNFLGTRRAQVEIGRLTHGGTGPTCTDRKEEMGRQQCKNIQHQTNRVQNLLALQQRELNILTEKKQEKITFNIT